MGGWVEILFPISEIDDPQTRAWFVDGGANQSWSNIFGSGGSFAPGAIPHQIGTDTVLQFTPPPPPAPPAPPQCLSNFIWKSNYLVENNIGMFNTPDQPQTNQIDLHGNFYVPGHQATIIFDPNGNTIASLTTTSLADSVDAWFGSPIVDRGVGFTANIGFYATPILQGQYIVAFFRAASGFSFAYWYAILQPSASGPPTLLGAIYYHALLGPPYVDYLDFMGLANRQTINDPIMFRGNFALGAVDWTIGILPSISDIITGKYRTGYPGYVDKPCRVPVVIYYPIANTNFSRNLAFNSFSPDVFNLKTGFTLPNSSGGTNVYFYIDRATMDYNASPLASAVTKWPEVVNVLEPAYPNGCIVKINMGVIDYASAAATAFSTSSVLSTPMYTVDNAAWNDGTSAQIPFTDEYTYLSTGSAGGTDAYVMQPGAIIDRGNGLWWVIFYMIGYVDTLQHNLDRFYESVRIFQYDAASEVATQILKQTCVLYTNNDIPIPGTSGVRENRQAWSISDAGGLIRLHINGWRWNEGANKCPYKTDFLQFTP